MTEAEQGPYRQDGRPPPPPRPWSGAAVASLPTVILGWVATFSAASSGVGALGLGLVVLLAGVTLAGFGLAATQPRLLTGEEASPGLDGDAPPPVPAGRGVAKLALGIFLTPIVLGCIGLGLLFLACGGH